MNNTFSCPRCGNTSLKYVGYKNGVPYCRKCIEFQGATVNYEQKKPKQCSLRLNYQLSKEQKSLSNKIISNYINKKDTLVYAVTGSGKTEISYGVILYAMSHGQNVAFAVPRKDVVVELASRLKSAFPLNSIVAIYGGHVSKLTGDCLVLTTHQLYRYENYFDLIVMDEVDAFPFKGNDVLEAMFFRSLRGNFLLMSATPSKKLIQGIKKRDGLILTLHTRFHKKPIPVPTLMTMPLNLGKLFLIKKIKEYRQQNKPLFIFVPTVEMSESLFLFLSKFCKGGNYVSSKREGREKIISMFKKGKYRFLVTTAVLERGVTVKNIQIIVFSSDSKIYDSPSLIQIAGRAGRKIDAPRGEVIFVGKKITEAMENAKSEIERCNRFL